MANHFRRQLREATATAVTGLTTTGTRVYQSRLYPLQTTDLPCLVVTTDGDKRDYLTGHYPEQVEAEVIVRIDGYAMATTNLDDTLDLISKEVEIAICTAINSGSLADFVELAGTVIDESVVGNQPVGKVSMAYRMKVIILANAPDVIL